MKILVIICVLSPFLFALNVKDLDRTFGNNGVVKIDFEQGLQNYSEVSLTTTDKQGRVYLLSEWEYPNENHHKLGVARFDSKGNLDRSFGTGGRVVFTPDAASAFTPVFFAVLSTGKLLIVGLNSNIEIGSQLMWMRLSTRGFLDQSYATNGVHAEPFDNTLWINNYSAQLLPDDSFILSASRPELAPRLYKVGANGVLDKKFAKNGIWEGPLHLQNGFDPMYFAINPQGQIFILMSEWDGNHPHMQTHLLCLNSDTTYCNEFGEKGIKLIDLVQEEETYALITIDKKGKLILAGATPNKDEALGEKLLVRLDSSGKLDTSFGNQGIFRTSKNNTYPLYHYHLATDSQGHIMLATRPYNEFWIERFTPEGKRDLEFGEQGILKPKENTVSMCYLKTYQDDFFLYLATSSNKTGDAATVRVRLR